jgi:hypothetical protein
VRLRWTVEDPCGFMSDLTHFLGKCAKQRTWYRRDVEYETYVAVDPRDLPVLRAQLEEQLKAIDEIEGGTAPPPNGP